MSLRGTVVSMLVLLSCGACGAAPEARSPAEDPGARRSSAPRSPTHDADCKRLVDRLDRIEDEAAATPQDERADVALRAAMDKADQMATELEGFAFQDETARTLAVGIAAHMRSKRAHSTKLLPALGRYADAVVAAKKTPAAAGSEAAVVTAQAEVLAVLEEPDTKKLEARLEARGDELARQLHEECGGPKPVSATGPGL